MSVDKNKKKNNNTKKKTFSFLNIQKGHIPNIQKKKLKISRYDKMF